MKKHVIAFGAAFILSSAVLGGLVIASNNDAKLAPTFSGVDPYTLSVDSYDKVVNGALTGNGNRINFASSKLTSGAGVGSLASGGTIYNVTPISGIGRINVVLASGAIEIAYGKNSNVSWDDFVTGPSADFESIRPNYFKITATSNAVITSFSVQYDCVDYQAQAESIPYDLQINGQPITATFIDATKPGEGYDKQYKVTLDLYAGDVLAFFKDEALISPSAGSADSNNAYFGNGRMMIRNSKRSADVYFKVTGNNYDVWISGKDDPFTESSLQDGNILQAWDWSIATIKSNLQAIADAGYRSVQVSPLQVRKYISTSSGWTNEWWKFYQPQSLSINQYSDNALGNRDALVDLCATAKGHGIDIIMDVVVNHLGGGSWNAFDSEVQYWEKDIYQNNRKHNLGRMGNDPGQLGYGQEALLRGAMGDFPDLKTEDYEVQERALSLFEDYLDCGVAGFRIDAAKHIETPFDGAYASSFWPHVINGAKRYAAKKGYDIPYCYGEILGAGDDRNINWYAPYMSITEGANDYDLREGVNNGNINKISGNYYAGLDAGPKQYVLWAESHDLFKDNHTRSMSEANINKVYAIQASRAKANSLYMARPEDNTNIGEMGKTWWRGNVPAAVNKLHNRFAGASEYIEVNNNNNQSFVNVRGSGAESGAVVVNIANGNSSYSVHLPGMANGEYVDLVSGKNYTVNNEYATLSFTNGVCVLSPKTGVPVYYLVGNDIFADGRGAAWSTASGIVLTRSGSNIAEIHDHRFEEGAEVKVLRQQEGADDVWYNVVLPEAYDYCSLQNNNLHFDKGGTYSIFLNDAAKYYVTGTPDEQGGGESSSESSSSSSSQTSPEPQATYTVTFAVTKNVGNGKGVYMLGDFTDPTWDLAASPRGSWTEGNVWKVTLTKPAGTTISFKFVCAAYENPSDIDYWEGNPNHTYTFSKDTEVSINWQ